MYNCLSRSIPELHFACFWDVQQPRDKPSSMAQVRSAVEKGCILNIGYLGHTGQRKTCSLYIGLEKKMQEEEEEDDDDSGNEEDVCLLVGCLTSQKQASVSQGRTCSDNFTCCHAEIEVADQTFYLTQSQYTDAGSTSPSVDPITPGAWQGSHWSANF